MLGPGSVGATGPVSLPSRTGMKESGPGACRSSAKGVVLSVCGTNARLQVPSPLWVAASRSKLTVVPSADSAPKASPTVQSKAGAVAIGWLPPWGQSTASVGQATTCGVPRTVSGRISRFSVALLAPGADSSTAA